MDRPPDNPFSQREPVATPDRGLAPAAIDLWGFEEEPNSKPVAESVQDIRDLYLRREATTTSADVSVAAVSQRHTMVAAAWARVRSHLPSDRRIVAGLAIVGVLGALLIGLSSYDGARSMTTLSGTTYNTAVERLASAVDGALELIGIRAADPVAPANVASASTEKTRTVRRPAEKRGPLDSGHALQLPLVSTEAAQAIQPAPIGTPQDDSEVDMSIYSTDDIEVSPPVAIRSPGRVDRGKPQDGASLIEILVSETGAVEWVREQQRPATLGAALEAATALSVVKTWQFQPALKNGHPVKYRTTVPFVQTMSPAGMREGVR